MSDLSRFFKHSSIYAIGNLANRIGAFLLLPVYTNYLSVAEYGTIELLYVLSAVVSGILAVGMAHATLRFYFDFEKQRDRHASISTNYLGSLAITLTGALLLAQFAEQITMELFDSTELVVGVYLVLATLVFELSSEICYAYIRARERSGLYVAVSFVKLIVQVGLCSYLVIFEGAGVIGVLTGNLVTVVLGWVVLSGYMLRQSGLAFHLSKLIPVLKYCFPFFLGTIVGIFSSNANKFILNYLISIEALGIFALALKFAKLLEQLVGEPFSTSYGAFRYTIMDQDNAGKLQADIVRYLLIIAVLGALGASLFVGDLLMVMSDESFWPAAQLVPLLMIASILQLMIYPVQTGILYAKKTRFIFHINWASAIVAIVASLVLIYYYGIIGACLALVVTKFFTLGLTHYFARRFFEVPYELWRLIKIFLIGAAVYAVSLLFVGLNVWLAFGLKLGLVGVFIVLVFIGSALDRDESAKVFEFINVRLLRRPASA